MMEKLGRTLAAAHIILMEEEADGFHLSCTYEWHAEDCAPLRQRLQHTTILENKPFYDAFHNSPVLLVDNAAVYQERHPELATIHQGELERYAIGQLMIEHRSLGTSPSSIRPKRGSPPSPSRCIPSCASPPS